MADPVAIDPQAWEHALDVLDWSQRDTAIWQHLLPALDDPIVRTILRGCPANGDEARAAVENPETIPPGPSTERRKFYVASARIMLPRDERIALSAVEDREIAVAGAYFAFRRLRDTAGRPFTPADEHVDSDLPRDLGTEAVSQITYFALARTFGEPIALRILELRQTARRKLIEAWRRSETIPSRVCSVTDAEARSAMGAQVEYRSGKDRFEADDHVPSIAARRAAETEADRGPRHRLWREAGIWCADRGLTAGDLREPPKGRLAANDPRNRRGELAAHLAGRGFTETAIGEFLNVSQQAVSKWLAAA